MFSHKVFATILIIWGCAIENSGADSMAIDLGSDSMKVAIVMPRKPMEIVLDGESSRKTSTAIAFRNGERLFGRAAVSVAMRSPELVFQSIPILLGKTLDHAAVGLFRDRYPYHNLSYDETIGQLTLAHPNGDTFTIEELVAMLLEYAKDIAEAHAGKASILRSVVLTVPSFYGQAERRSLMRAAELAGLDVIQLMSTNAAVALNFGVFRHSSFNATPQYYLFYDLGHTTTTATVASYQTSKRMSQSVEDNVLSIIGVGCMPTLGAATFIYRLRDYLVRLFNATHPDISGDITQNHKSMTKLTLEAAGLFRMLSANTEVLFQVENLFQGKDFQVKVTRAELESINADTLEQLREPFMDALKDSKLNIADIREIVLMGGGTRVPKVQSLLMELGNRSELSKGVNSDEASVLGAVYQAAARSPGFRVIPFIVRDYNPYSIAVDFKRATGATLMGGNADAESTDEPVQVRRILFPRGSPYPQKRAITFNRHTEDLVFSVNYELESNHAPLLNLSEATTIGVNSSLARHPEAEMRGVKAHFTLDESGLLVLTGVDCVFHPITESPVEGEDQSTLKKLGDKISGFFGSIGSGSSGEPPNTTDTAAPPSTSNGSQLLNETEAPTTKVPNNDTSNVPGKTSATPSMNHTKKVAMFSERISFKLVHLDHPIPAEDHWNAAKEKLRTYREIDQAKRDLEYSMNRYESALLSLNEKAQSEAYMNHSTAEELSSLSQLFSSSSRWFDDHGYEATKEDFDEKFDEIWTKQSPIEFRVTQAKNRPRAFDDLNKETENARQFLKLMMDTMEKLPLSKPLPAPASATKLNDTNGTSTNASTLPPVAPPLPPLFTDSEQQSLKTLLTNSESWVAETRKKLDAASPFERPPVLVEEIEEKQRQLKREVAYLNKKLLHWQIEMERLLRLQTAQFTTPPIVDPGENHTTPGAAADQSVPPKEPVLETNATSTEPKDEL